MENVALFALVIALVWGIPILVCIVMARARGRKWYWFALLGLLSVLGLVIALVIPAAEPKIAVPEALQGQADRVKLIWGKGPSYHHAIREVEAQVAIPQNLSLAPGGELNLAGQALRVEAVRVGANAVTQVEFFWSKPPFWALSAAPVLTARGMAVSLGQEEYARAASNAEELWQGVNVEDPQESLSRRLRSAGTWTIIWGVINLVAVLSVLSQLNPEEGIPAILLGILLLCVWLLVLGVWLLKVRSPRMLIWDGITLCIIGAVNLLIFGAFILAALQIFSGIGSIRAHRLVVRGIAEYKETKAEIDQKIRAAEASF